MSADRERAIEEASLRAWPAIMSEALGGWELRFAHGFTGRANSVQPLGDPLLPLEEAVTRCEAWYEARGLPCRFRITPFADPDLDSRLARRGYFEFDDTTVMRRALDRGRIVAGGQATVGDVPMTDWLPLYDTLSTLAEGPPPAMRGILEACRRQQRFGVARLGSGEPGACGLAVHDGAFVGLFDLVTAAGLRRRGLCTALVADLLAWGESLGATDAYLQEVRANTPAVALYEKLGFETAYDYWYRIRPS